LAMKWHSHDPIPPTPKTINFIISFFFWCVNQPKRGENTLSV